MTNLVLPASLTGTAFRGAGTRSSSVADFEMIEYAVGKVL